MELRDLSERLTTCLAGAVGVGTIYPAREDSRAFGAMLEGLVFQAWPAACAVVGGTPRARPGRRSI